MARRAENKLQDCGCYTKKATQPRLCTQSIWYCVLSLVVLFRTPRTWPLFCLWRSPKRTKNPCWSSRYRNSIFSVCPFIISLSLSLSTFSLFLSLSLSLTLTLSFSPSLSLGQAAQLKGEEKNPKRHVLLVQGANGQVGKVTPNTTHAHVRTCSRTDASSPTRSIIHIDSVS
jgi:hypothetical protein